MARSENDLYSQSLSAASDRRVLRSHDRRLYGHDTGQLPGAEHLAGPEDDLYAEPLSAATNGRVLLSGWTL